MYLVFCHGNVYETLYIFYIGYDTDYRNGHYNRYLNLIDSPFQSHNFPVKEVRSAEELNKEKHLQRRGFDEVRFWAYPEFPQLRAFCPLKVCVSRNAS